MVRGNIKKFADFQDKGLLRMLTQAAKMEIGFYDETPAWENEECEIRINDGEIVVSYEDDHGVVVYKGKDEGTGHFVLECPAKRAKATLHQFPKSKFLEGFWLEEGSRGFWRITLP